MTPDVAAVAVDRPYTVALAGAAGKRHRADVSRSPVLCSAIDAVVTSDLLCLGMAASLVDLVGEHGPSRVAGVVTGHGIPGDGIRHRHVDRAETDPVRSVPIARTRRKGSVGVSAEEELDGKAELRGADERHVAARAAARHELDAPTGLHVDDDRRGSRIESIAVHEPRLGERM